MIVQPNQKIDVYPDLSPGQPYLVIGIEADDYRLLNDRGQPYLYPSDMFDVVDPVKPGDWIDEVGSDGERYAYPVGLNAPGFFEDFFEGKPVAVQTFWQTINHSLTAA